MMVIDPVTGRKAEFASKTTIIEVYKKNIRENEKVINLDIKNRLKHKNILRFYKWITNI